MPWQLTFRQFSPTATIPLVLGLAALLMNPVVTVQAQPTVTDNPVVQGSAERGSRRSAAQNLVNRGIHKSSQGDVKGALVDYNQAIQLDPEYALAYIRRGVILYSLEIGRAHV